jgi:DNA-binding response OmpR family regulator
MASSKRKILIVEDEPFLCEMYKTKFEALGYEVLVADNGEQGIAMMREHRPDIVLLDIIMPVMDGYSVLKVVRADPDLKGQLIVIFSNLGQEEEVAKGLQLGADDYLVKSNLTPSELLKKVEAVLMKGRSDKAETMKPIRVLLVEDTRDIIDLYTARFQHEGFECQVAENGAWGLKVAQTSPFDVILLDLMMPALNGVEALRTLRATPSLKETPILVLTSSGEPHELEAATAAGATEVFLKPRVTPTQLVNRIRELVKR